MSAPALAEAPDMPAAPASFDWDGWTRRFDAALEYWNRAETATAAARIAMARDAAALLAVSGTDGA